GQTIRQVAWDTHIPQATLQRHAAGDVEHFGPGRPTYFTVEEEKRLASALTVLQRHAEFKLKTPLPLEKSRANVSGSIVTKWFDLTDAGYNTSNNGWMEEVTFFQWFMKLFLKHSKNIPRPLLLLLDGHASHRSVRLIQAAIEHEVILLALRPHTTHILQPLDVVVFKPVKDKWKQILASNQNSDKTVNKDRFPGLLAQLFEKGAIKKSNIVQ
ncbi:unnamed protein product, partial [Didymodactylos carnosus]